MVTVWLATWLTIYHLRCNYSPHVDANPDSTHGALHQMLPRNDLNTTQPNGDLPDGWSYAYSENNIYYYNTQLNLSQYERPIKPSARAALTQLSNANGSVNNTAAMAGRSEPPAASDEVLTPDESQPPASIEPPESEVGCTRPAPACYAVSPHLASPLLTIDGVECRRLPRSRSWPRSAMCVRSSPRVRRSRVR